MRSIAAHAGESGLPTCLAARSATAEGIGYLRGPFPREVGFFTLVSQPKKEHPMFSALFGSLFTSLIPLLIQLILSIFTGGAL